MKKLSIIIILGLFSTNGISQTDSLFKKVNRMQQLRLKHVFTNEREEVFKEFDQSIQKLFEDKNCCDFKLYESHSYFLKDKLSEITEGQTLAYAFMNNIVVCSADDIKIYSWDNLEGGSSHSYTNYLQFEDQKGNCITQPLDTAFEDLEVGYYSIEKLKAKKELFLLFGFGTYGGGSQHFSVRIFEHNKRGMVECFECYPDGEAIFIFCNRSQQVDLKYDSKTKILSFKQYVADEEMGFFTNEFNLQSFKFANGKLVE